MPASRDKSDFAKCTIPKSLGAGQGVQDSGGVNKNFYTPGHAKPYTSASENRPPRCLFCNKLGHVAKNCWADKSTPAARTLFNKSSKQTRPATTPKSGTSQVKVNLVSVQSGLPPYSPHARLATEIPEKLIFPPPEVYQEANEMCREIEARSVKSAQMEIESDAFGENDLVDTVSITICTTGTLTDHLVYPEIH